MGFLHLRHGFGRPKDPMFAAEAFGSRVGLDPSDERLTALFLDHLQQQILTVFRPVLADSLFELITLGTSLHAYRLVRVTVDYEADDLPASTPVTGYNSPSDGPGNGPARRIANALGTSSVVIRSFPTSIACSAIAYGTGSGNDGRSRLPGARGRRCTDGQLHRDLEGAHHKSRGLAPGTAEALLATALGLVAAMPAVMIYKLLARSTAHYRA